MAITVTRDRSHRMTHTLAVRDHRITVDELPAIGGDDLGPTPHDLFDSAVAACKALTVVWYANRKQIPLEDVSVSIERDDREERQGTYRLCASLRFTGPLSDAQRAELLTVAGKCPVHKLVTQVKTEVVTEMAED